MDDQSPLQIRDAETYFSPFADEAALVAAVSGGPDSLALMWLLAGWRAARKSGPDILVVTVDHGLRKEAAREARDVKAQAMKLGLAHRTMRWTGEKPTTGVPAAARLARYDLLSQAARRMKARYILTAHTLDDQAETVLMRMSRGSGIAGLSGMAALTGRSDVVIARPLLGVPKSRLIATLKAADIPYASDPSNSDATYTRPRFRALMPALADEGCDARNLARFAGRMARANEALERMVDGAEQLLQMDADVTAGIELAAFGEMPEEIRIRLLMRWIGRIGHEGPVELGKAEQLAFLIADLVGQRDPAHARMRKSLAGAVVSLGRGRLRIEPAPPRRGHA